MSRHRAEPVKLARSWRWKLCMTGDLAVFIAATVVAGWSLTHGGS